MDTSLFIVFWIIQILVSIFVWVIEKDITDLPSKVKSYKAGAILFGFFPCGGFMLPIQIMMYAIYKIAKRMIETKTESLIKVLEAAGTYDDLSDAGFDM